MEIHDGHFPECWRHAIGWIARGSRVGIQGAPAELSFDSGDLASWLFLHTGARIHTYIRTYVHTYIRAYAHTHIRTYILYIHTM